MPSAALAAVLPDRAGSRWWFLAGLVVLFAVVSVAYSRKIVQTVERSHTEYHSRSALMRWLPQLRDLRDGENPYVKHNYPNPPIMALLLLPFTLIPPTAAALIWFYLKVGMAIAALLWSFRLVETPTAAFPDWAKAVVVLLALRPIVGDLSHGNINLFILFLTIGALVLFRAGRDFSAGLTLALAIACKVTPALLVPYFVYKRAWKTLAGLTLGLGLFLLVIPGAWFGHERNLTLLHSWYTVMVKPFTVDGKVTPEHQNQSLPGLTYRLATHHPAFSTYVEDEVTHVDLYTPVTFVNVVDVGPRVAGLFLKACLLAFAGLVLWTCGQPIQAPGWNPRLSWRHAAEFSLILLGMLLFSERTWKHHAVTLVLPFAVLVYAVAVLPLRRGMRYGLGSAVVLALALMTLTSESVLGKDGADWAMVYGAWTAVFGTLIVATAVLLRAVETQPPPLGAKLTSPGEAIA